MPARFAIIVAGGSGSRMHTPVPKQFMPLSGKPILAWSIEAFHTFDPGMEIIVALPEQYMSQWQELYKESYSHIPHHVVRGGQERFHSVLNALNTIRDQAVGLVAIHDAARPFVSQRLINDTFYHAEVNGSAVPALKIKDTIRAYSLGQWVPADRDSYRTIQTPQVFDIKSLKKAYLRHYSTQFTDDATVWESAGNPVHLVDGDEQNFKITTPLDMEFAQYLAEKERISRK